MSKYFFIICSILGLGVACDTKSNCVHAAPQPMFSKEMMGVAAHSFKAKESESTEEIIVPEAFRLEVFQSGCEKVTQEFRYHIPGDFRTSKINWVEFAADFIYQTSGLDDKVMKLQDWAVAIGVKSKEAREGENFLIAEGHFDVKVTHVPSQDSLLLSIQIAEK